MLVGDCGSLCLWDIGSLTHQPDFLDSLAVLTYLNVEPLGFGCQSDVVVLSVLSSVTTAVSLGVSLLFYLCINLSLLP